MINVEGLSKVYSINGRGSASGPNLREALTEKVKAFGRFGNAASNKTEDFWALKDVSFDVAQGDRVGIIGRNGAGKSTLLKILSRITEPSAGRVRLRGRVASLLEVGTGFHPELSGRENIFMNGSILGMTRSEILERFDDIVEFSGIEKFLDTPTKRYSSGMQVRLAFAVAAHLEPEILIIDEVLAVGDVAFQKKCLGKMHEATQSGRTVLFVSHNTAALLNLCNRGIVLQDGEVVCDDKIRPAVDKYTQSMLTSGQNVHNGALHTVYQKDPKATPQGEFEFIKIELLDEQGAPKEMVKIWDGLTFRFTYCAQRALKRGAIDFQIISPDGQPLLYLSTQPDGSFPFDIEEGTHSVECHINQLPLSAGRYRVVAGMAVPNVEWLAPLRELGGFTIQETDVYQSGNSPSSSRSLLAVAHHWQLP